MGRPEDLLKNKGSLELATNGPCGTGPCVTAPERVVLAGRGFVAVGKPICEIYLEFDTSADVVYLHF
jgi:hypothetical protein